MLLFIAALAGYVPSAYITRINENCDKRWNSHTIAYALAGFSAGMSIAFVCFELLPPIYAYTPVFKGVALLVAGSAAAYLLDKWLIEKYCRFPFGPGFSYLLLSIPLLAAVLISRFVFFTSGMALYAACGAILPGGLRQRYVPMLSAMAGFVAGLTVLLYHS